MTNSTIRITEIFTSLQGEAKFSGIPTTFIRLTGCPLRCQYCDTAYAFSGGIKTSVSDVIYSVKKSNVTHVCVTGGEPLAQPGCIELMQELVKSHTVSIETSGALDISQIPSEVIKVMDLKTPDSKEEHRNLWSNLDYITKTDQIKFVICSDADYEWAKDVVNDRKLSQFCEVLFSPSVGQMDPTRLADLIIKDRLPVRFQIQLHKYLWGDKPGV